MLPEGFTRPSSQIPVDFELLAGTKREEFALQRFANFARLHWWLVAPDDPVRTEWAVRTAIARAVRDTLKALNPDVPYGEEQAYVQAVMADHFDTRTLTFALLTMPDLVEWTESHRILRSEADTAAVMASTLLKLDQDRTFGPPSMNKALYMAQFSDTYDDGVSHQKARDLWAEFGRVTPFLVAAHWLSNDPDEFEAEAIVTLLPPNHPRFFDYYLAICDDRLARWLRIATSLQMKLQDILTANAVAPVPFIDWPTSIAPESVAVPPLTFDEIRRLKGYTAND